MSASQQVQYDQIMAAIELKWKGQAAALERYKKAKNLDHALLMLWEICGYFKGMEDCARAIKNEALLTDLRVLSQLLIYRFSYH